MSSLCVDPPLFHLEIKNCLQKAIPKRDGRIKAMQEQIAACIGGIMSISRKVLQRALDVKLLILESMMAVV